MCILLPWALEPTPSKLQMALYRFMLDLALSVPKFLEFEHFFSYGELPLFLGENILKVWKSQHVQVTCECFSKAV